MKAVKAAKQELKFETHRAKTCFLFKCLHKKFQGLFYPNAARSLYLCKKSQYRCVP